MLGGRGTAALILPVLKAFDSVGPGCHAPSVGRQTSLAAFALAVPLISASPGPAMALIFRGAALRGLRGAVPTVRGLALGLYGWALFGGAGFAALVAASEAAYLVLRVGAWFVVRAPGAGWTWSAGRCWPQSPAVECSAAAGGCVTVTKPEG